MLDSKTEAERIIKFIKDYIDQSNADGIILGVSGGIDSAVVAVLAKQATENLHCYYLPMIDMKDDIDKIHIKKLYQRFDLTYQTREIGLDVEGIIDDISINGISKVTYGNIKARIRMTILYHYANRLSCLVVGTTNKSELLTGYFTKYGDGGVDIEPIQHLYKTEIFELAKYLNIPEEIINKTPTAGLWKGQTDEDELGMTYKELDKCLRYYEFVSNSPRALTEIFYNTEDGKKLKNMEPNKMKHVIELIKKSEHKRKPVPALKRD